MVLPALNTNMGTMLPRFLAMKSSNTCKRYEKILLRMWTSTQPSLFFDDQVQLASFVAGLPSDGTRKLYLNVFRSWIKFLNQEGINIGFPFKNPYKTRILSKPVLTEVQARLLMDDDVFHVLFMTGLRVSELCNLLPSDIDGEYINVKGKGGKSRLIKVSQRTIESIQKLRNMDRFQVYTHIKQLGASINTSLCPHAIRATACTLLLKQGNDVLSVAQWMGHSSVNTTQMYNYRTSELEIEI